MHAIAQLLLLPSWNSAIDFSPMAVAPDTPLLDAIALMSQCQPQASRVLVVENSQVVGCGVEYRFLHQDGTYRWVYDIFLYIIQHVQSSNH